MKACISQSTLFLKVKKENSNRTGRAQSSDFIVETHDECPLFLITLEH